MRLLSTALNNNKNQHFYKNEKYQTCRLRTQQTLGGIVKLIWRHLFLRKLQFAAKYWCISIILRKDG